MTTHHSQQPEDDDHRPIDPLRPDRLRCDCGAVAGRDGRCRKCRARAAWTRRNAGRRPGADQPPTQRRGPGSRAGRERRTGR